MTTVTASPRRPRPLARLRPPDWFERAPSWAIAGGALVVLIAISAYLRTRFIGGQFWMDEAITTGISSHSLSAIPGILRHDGNPPLFYLLLHGWMTLFGSSESATHALSLLFGLLAVPAGMWAGWTLFGRKTGLMAGVLFAFNAWFTYYAQETRMYELMGLLGIVATVAFIQAFIHRRRGYLIVFTATLALMLYTHSWGAFVVVGGIVALVPAYFVSEDRRALIRDAVLAFVGAVILYVPWLPNFLYQAAHTAAPWDEKPGLGTPILISRDVLGSDRVTVVLLAACVVGLAGYFTRRMRRTREAAVVWTLFVFPIATLFVAWLSSQITPAYVPRYFAPVVASILLLAALGCARAGVLGYVALVASAIFLLNTSSVVPPYKSDMRDVGGEMAPLVHPGDVVVSGQPEQTPLTWYYLPNGLRFVNTAGPVSDPTYMNWVNALSRLKDTNPAATLGPLVASLRPGQQLLYIRPLTEGAQNWEAPWTALIRRRSAQWGAILQADVDRGELSVVAVAPHYYHTAPDIADSAVLYKRNA